MRIGFVPCGMTIQQTVNKLQALGGNNIGNYKGIAITNLYWYIDTSDGCIHCHDPRLDVVLDPSDIPGRIDKISDLPEEMRRLIALRQIEAGNQVNLDKFDKDRTLGARKGGFEWAETPEKSDFWCQFLYHKKYYLYYTLNIKQDETKLQRKETSIGRSQDITGSGIRCERCKPAIAGGHLRDRKAIVF